MVILLSLEKRGESVEQTPSAVGGSSSEQPEQMSDEQSEVKSEEFILE